MADEAKFYKEETLRSGVLPMLMQGAVIIYASTPDYGSNPCESIINGMFQDEPITEYVNFKLTCDLCAPIADIDQDYVCYHRIGWRPPMQDPEIVGITQAAFGNADAFQREVMANQIRTVDSYVRKPYIDHMHASAWFKFEVPPDEIFIAVDPASNSLNWDEGSRSYLGIVSGCFVDGQLVVSFIYVSSQSALAPRRRPPAWRARARRRPRSCAAACAPRRSRRSAGSCWRCPTARSRSTGRTLPTS